MKISSESGDFHLRKKLIIIFLVFSLIPLTVVGLGSYFVGKSLIENDVIAHLRSIARSKSKIVDTFIQERTSDLRVLAATLARTGNDDERLARIRSVIARYNVYVRIEEVDSEGGVLLASGPDSVRKGCEYLKACIQSAIAGREYMGKVFLWNEVNQSVFVICVPIDSDRTRQERMLIGYISLLHVGKVLREFEEGKTGEAYLIDDMGRFLSETRLGGELLTDMIPEHVRKVYFEGSGSGEHIDYRGKMVLGVGHKVPDMDWFVIAEQDSDEAFRGIRTFGVSVFLIWCAIIVAVIGTAIAISNALNSSLQNKYREILDLKAYSEDILASLPVSVIVMDKNLSIISTNRSFVKIFGLSGEEILDSPVENIINNSQIIESLRRTAETGETFSRESVMILLKNGEKRYFNIRASALRISGESQVLLVLSDVTDYRRVQEQIQKAEKLSSLGTLTAGVAHELNTPLANILLYTQMSLEQIPTDEKELSNNLQAVVEEARRGATIVKELLEFSRQSDLEVDIADINEIIANLLSLVKSQCKLNKIRIESEYDYSIPRLKTDLGRLQQVFMNLVSNAIWAMPEGGILTVKTEYNREYNSIRVTVNDNGIGIPRENIGKIFDPFFTTKRPGEGTGLGLSVSHGIVQKLGGNITAASEANNISPDSEKKGVTTFTVELPVSDQDSDEG